MQVRPQTESPTSPDYLTSSKAHKMKCCLCGCYEFLVGLFGIPVHFFFRDIKAFGVKKLPEEGPTIFCVGPHVNMFIDPMMVCLTSRKRIGWLAAQITMDRTIVGRLAKGAKAIPVSRPSDYAIPAAGTISSDGATVTGVDTAFQANWKPKMSIKIQKSWPPQFKEVVSVQSDTSLTLKTPFDNEVTDAKFSWVPHIDQEVMFKAVEQRLANGGCVGIFPEGFSHDEHHLIPFKAGVAIIALQTMLKYPGMSVTLVPTGLNYFAGDHFRSRAYVQYGQPIPIPLEYVDRYKAGGEEKRSAISDVLNAVEMGLKAVTLNADDAETLTLLHMSRRLALNFRATTEQKLKYTRLLAQGYEKHSNNPNVQALRKDIIEYTNKLQLLHIRDNEIQNYNPSICLHLGKALLNLFLVVLFGLCAIPGLIINFPSAPIVGVVSRVRGAKEGRDAIASWKVMIGSGLIPFVWCLWWAAIIVVTLLVVPTKTSTEDGVPIWGKIIIIVLALPFLILISYGCVRFFETGRRKAGKVRAHVGLILHRQTAKGLQDERAGLVLRVTAMTDMWGPQVQEAQRQQASVGFLPATPEVKGGTDENSNGSLV